MVDIQTGQEWTRASLNGDGTVGKQRRVKVLGVEGANVLIEEIEQPAHKEYGHPRRWVPRASFVDDETEIFRRFP
jgi:hypothetical protein